MYNIHITPSATATEFLKNDYREFKIVTDHSPRVQESISMIELWLTVYGDQSSPLEDSSFLLDEFQTKNNVRVRVSRMAFEEAWPKLLEFALHGGGPHVSLVGGIWTSTIASMNVLRLFRLKRLTAWAVKMPSARLCGATRSPPATASGAFPSICSLIWCSIAKITWPRQGSMKPTPFPMPRRWKIR